MTRQKGREVLYCFLMIRLVFWLFVLFLALSYFGISVEQVVNSPAGQQNITYLGYLWSLFYAWLIAQVQ